jgi:hypothetical protein
MGEAAALTAQLVEGPDGPVQIGMNRAGLDNEQFALNTMHWLVGVLD